MKPRSRTKPAAAALTQAPAITLVLSPREARALAHAAEFVRAAFADAGSESALGVAHLRLLSAIERGEQEPC